MRCFNCEESHLNNINNSNNNNINNNNSNNNSNNKNIVAVYCYESLRYLTIKLSYVKITTSATTAIIINK